MSTDSLRPTDSPQRWKYFKEVDVVCSGDAGVQRADDRESMLVAE